MYYSSKSVAYAILIVMAQYISVDIGGTQLRAACFSPGNIHPNQIMRASTRGSVAGNPKETALDRLITLIQNIWPEGDDVLTISVAAPGPVNPRTGVLLSAPNIPGWIDVPLRQVLEERFKTPVLLGNDANMAALGEWKYGVGKGHQHMIYLTISTGIGGGVIINNELLIGANGLAGELGHVTVMQDGPLCGCGQRGHLEALSSGTAIAQWVTDELSQGAQSSIQLQQKITARLVSEAAQAGDALCIAALERSGYFIGQALANFLHIFNPTMIVIGGGVSRSGPLLLEPLKKSLQEHILSPSFLQNLKIETAAFGDEAGLIGAFVLGQSQFPH